MVDEQWIDNKEAGREVEETRCEFSMSYEQQDKTMMEDHELKKKIDKRQACQLVDKAWQGEVRLKFAGGRQRLEEGRNKQEGVGDVRVTHTVS